MAAVAAEPGAAAASTTAGDGAGYEPEPGEHAASAESPSERDFVPGTDLCHRVADADAVQECGQVQMEMRRPDIQAAGKALAGQAEDGRADASASWSRVAAAAAEAEELGLPGCNCTEERRKDARCETANACLPPSSISASQPSAVFLHSLPAHPVETETGLSLSEAAEPAVEFYGDPESTRPADIERDFMANSEPEPASDAPASALKPPEDAFHGRPPPPAHPESPPSSLEETSLGESVGQSCLSDFSTISSKDSPELPAVAEPSLASSESEDVDGHPVLAFQTDPSPTGAEPEPESEPESKAQVSCAETVITQKGPMEGLVPGSEVRVSLDHIIDDALVVSFRLGEKIFSGVLMDLSKRFGPYGIPITVFPKREYKDKPESMQLKTEAFQSETEKGVGEGTPDAPPKEPSEAPSVPQAEAPSVPQAEAPSVPQAEAPSVPQASPNPQPHPWTSKPPPLFQEGAPYPPPLFIRDTYNQSLPQPPPRKIKRPKRRLYREEPTSILNAIKLRPRQVLCDKCKGAVVQGDKRETRRGPVSDCRGDDAKRRRNEVAGKRPRSEARSEDRSRAADSAKRHTGPLRVTPSSSSSSSTSSSTASPTLGQSQVKGAAAGNRMARGVAPSSANSGSRVQLNAKKVLQSKNVEHTKAREVLKKAQKRQRETVAGSGTNTKAMTRAAALQEAHQKVHFTRRLQQISGGGPAMSNPLPPRMRIKPQRYRNEENDSSSCKPPCLEKMPGGGRLALPKLAAPHCTSTRSSSSSSCSPGQATAAGDPQGPDRALKPTLSQAQTQPHPHSAPEHRDPHPDPEEQEGRETRGSKAGNLVVYMTLNSSQPDSSSTSMCSVDSADDLKSSNSECSSTETLDFPPPGDFRSAPGPSSTFTSTSPTSPKEEKKRSKSLKAAVFSKNVSKCVALDGRTICVGDIVWAKILGFPWWPARILAITVSRKDNGLLVRQEARVSWFGSPTTSFLAITQLAPFLENFQSRFDKKRKGLYRKAITEAAKAAKQLTPEVRALLTQFET